MNKVQVLIEGYAKPTGKGDGWFASSTTTLITTEKGKKIIVDPGCNRKLLLEKLSELGLKPNDIDFVFMTHYHPDHNLLVGIFENATIFDDDMYYKNDEQDNHQGVIPGTDIKIIKTPGHEIFHGSLVVPTKNGVVVVGGDVFWWDDTEEQKMDIKSLILHKDPFVKDKKALKKSRQEVLKIAKYIIPGHGKMFEVKA